MYTLRLFKDVKETNRTQIYLGDSYVVKGVEKEDEKIGIKLRVYGNWDSVTKEGLAIHNDDHAFIMTPLGGTFETLNRPSIMKIEEYKNYRLEPSDYSYYEASSVIDCDALVLHDKTLDGLKLQIDELFLDDCACIEPELTEGGHPRRYDVNKWDEVEKAIYKSADLIENSGAHELLTKAQTSITEAANIYADWFESIKDK